MPVTSYLCCVHIVISSGKLLSVFWYEHRRKCVRSESGSRGFESHIPSKLSGCGRNWLRASFGTKNMQVRVLSPWLYCGVAKLARHLALNEKITGSSPVSTTYGDYGVTVNITRCDRVDTGSIPVSHPNVLVAQLDLERLATNEKVEGSSPSKNTIPI